MTRRQASGSQRSALGSRWISRWASRWGAFWGALARAQSAVAEASARPRKLALGSYALFAVAFVSLFPAVAGIALLASALNGVLTLACALVLATVERWAPRISSGQAPLFERTLQFATLLWLYAGGVFLAVSIGARL